MDKVGNKHNIKIFVMDVDGTLTDGNIYIGEKGEVFKSFNVKDGLGISILLKEQGILPVIITGRKSKIVEIRAKEIGINEIYQGIDNKVGVLKEISRKYSIDLQNISYIGDDINDLKCMKICGITACPNNSAENVKKYVDYICKVEGGKGAVREFIEFLLENIM